MPRVSLAIVRSQRRFHPPPTISGLSLEAGLELRETGLAHISCVFLANQRGITRIARPCGSSPWFSTTDFANHASPPSGVPASHASSVSPRIVLTRHGRRRFASCTARRRRHRRPAQHPASSALVPAVTLTSWAQMARPSLRHQISDQEPALLCLSRQDAGCVGGRARIGKQIDDRSELGGIEGHRT
jgi:hypothetical protein